MNHHGKEVQTVTWNCWSLCLPTFCKNTKRVGSYQQVRKTNRVKSAIMYPTAHNRCRKNYVIRCHILARELTLLLAALRGYILAWPPISKLHVTVAMTCIPLPPTARYGHAMSCTIMLQRQKTEDIGSTLLASWSGSFQRFLHSEQHTMLGAFDYLPRPSEMQPVCRKTQFSPAHFPKMPNILF